LSVFGERSVSRIKDLESFVGPKEVEIHPPKPSSTKGSGKRTKGGKEMSIEKKEKQVRHCKVCGGNDHDSQNCPTNHQNNVS